MLTIFSIPKPFAGHIGVIQRNAIRSWLRLRPECQVLLCGDEPGSAECATAEGIERITDVDRNEFGTPLLSSAFLAAERRAKHQILCYVNADILLLRDFVDAARRVAARKSRYLMVGQRWDLDVSEPIAFERDGWEDDLRTRTARSGIQHPPSGSDYFVYPRGAFGTLPLFAVGRPGWDNWMIYRARSLRIPVVDATGVALVIHQNHAYGHVKQATGGTWEGPEADRNLELIGTDERVFTLLDATHHLTPSGLARSLDPAHLWRRLRAMTILVPALGRIVAALRGKRRPAPG